jgi:MFS family permease
MFLGGSWVGRLYDNYGPRYILLIGSFLHVFGLMMASISTKYYQFLLSQGVCSAIGASMVFYPSFNCITTWFFKKRALSFGIAASGSSLGGVIFPIMVHKLIPQVGFPWTMRICAFLILALLIVANALIRSRIPPFPKPVKIMDFVRPATELRFGLLILVCGLPSSLEKELTLDRPLFCISSDSSSHSRSSSLKRHRRA